MQINLHKNARTTPAQRALIQSETKMSVSDLSSKIGVSETTVRRWKNRCFVFDKTHIPKKIVTALTPAQELIVVLIRLCLRPGLDDLKQIVCAFITSNCSRSSLNRCLKRYHISRLVPLQGDLPVNLNDYRGTFLYYTKIVFPSLPGMKKPFAIQVLLDCSFRWVHVDVSVSCSQPQLSFIKNVVQQFPLTVLGIIFTDPILLSDENFPGLSLRQDLLIKKFCEVHHLASCHSKTIPGNLLSRLRQTCSNLGKHHHTSVTNIFNFKSMDLIKNVLIYNTRLFQKTLKQKTPKQALENYYTRFPGSFRQRPTQFLETFSLLKRPDE